MYESIRSERKVPCMLAVARGWNSKQSVYL